MHQHIAKWLVVAFEAEVRDPRDILELTYLDRKLYIQPRNDEFCNLISTFIEAGENDRDVRTTINRFFSAMAWKDDSFFITRGSTAGGARKEERNNPRFNYREKKHYPYGVISQFDFEHLLTVNEDRQKLALALYREALGADNDFYRFLSFFKIINIIRPTTRDQRAWINANLDRVWHFEGTQRRNTLGQTVADIGEYLAVQGRCAIAHAFEQPIRDPDLPDDLYEIRTDMPLMMGLAQVVIQRELGVPSMRQISQEHLYELQGFKRLLGDAMSHRLRAGEAVELAELDLRLGVVLSVGLRGFPPFEGLESLHYEVLRQDGSVVVLGTRGNEPTNIVLALDFANERLELLLDVLAYRPNSAKYTRPLAASVYRFLIGLFSNGALEIYLGDRNERLSFKSAFIAVDIDLRATLDNFQARMDALLAPQPPPPHQL
jgi:hypothetical protein